MKAIETYYAGHRFRSRLEARYAVFFDRLGICWEYEPQGYQLPSGPYLPDFWLPSLRGGLWLEVKPENAPGDPRHEELAVHSGHDVAVTNGLPRSDASDNNWLEIWFAEGGADESYGFLVCDMHGEVVCEFGGYVSRGCSRCIDENQQFGHHLRVVAALDAAHSARFEHGESGAPS